MRLLKMCDCGRGSVYAKGLCNTCYKREWRKTTPAPLIHGTRHAYADRGCRCDQCFEAGVALRALLQGRDS